jgi:hypothetical protein
MTVKIREQKSVLDSDATTVYERVQRARQIAAAHPKFVSRFDAVTMLRATASSTNIEGGHSTPLGVARAVVEGGETLEP